MILIMCINVDDVMICLKRSNEINNIVISSKKYKFYINNNNIYINSISFTQYFCNAYFYICINDKYIQMNEKKIYMNQKNPIQKLLLNSNKKLIILMNRIYNSLASLNIIYNSIKGYKKIENFLKILNV